MQLDKRCTWCQSSELYLDYHDREWGIPCTDDRELFEMLNLEGAQAGLSWITILNKRENYRKAFAGFDPAKIARFSEAKVEKLMQDAGIVRNRLKINGVITNAKIYNQMQKDGISFSGYLWSFVDYKPLQNNRKTMKSVPATTAESDAMSKALKKQGFKFVGSTICYAFMQATGMVNDHLITCPSYKPCVARARKMRRPKAWGKP
ncbi:MAG: DNA-3-methyladenine glycosylase I [Granulosicoccus sp.]|nr:DNA-3-methyladenine glycosylase I [Granulosicoccus sp.]